ncbi:MAG: TRAP transporter small permease [Opitutaceae bacterium]|nr:TRAP transporter small permease [Opitutaceae bacterium]
MKALANAVGRIVALADRAAEILIIALFAVIVLVGGLQVLCRYVFNASLSWSEELQRYGLIWIVFLAIVVGYRRGAHIGMGLFLEKMPRAVQRPMGVFIDLLWLALGAAMVVFTAAYASASGLTFWRSVARQSSAGMGVRMDVIYACIVIGGAYLVLAALHNLLRRAAGEAPVIIAEEPPC